MNVQKSSEKKLRILHVGNHTFPCVGGIETVIWETAHAQVRAGHDVTILVFDSCAQGKKKLPALEILEGVTIIRTTSVGLTFYQVPSIRMFVDQIREHDLVHVHGFGPWLDIACISKIFHKKKIILSTHGGFFHTKKRKWLKEIYLRGVLPLIRGQIDFIIWINPEERKPFSVINRIPSVVIPNGIPNRFIESKRKGERYKDAFIFVGRLSSNKRVEHLIRSFARVAKTHSKATLHIVGGDWEGLRASLENEAKDAGIRAQVHFHGELTDEELMALYEICGVVVSASEYEGFGISVLEGMALGKIPVLNTIPTFCTFASHDRGFTADFSDPGKGSEAMEKVMNLSNGEFVHRSIDCRSYATEFSMVATEAKYFRVYSDVLGIGNQ